VLPPGVGRVNRTEVEGERDEVDDEFNELLDKLVVEIESDGLFCLGVEYELEVGFVMIKGKAQSTRARVCVKKRTRTNKNAFNLLTLLSLAAYIFF
jgi:hypothetical protein